MAFETLCSPIKVGSLTLKNRMTVSPMGVLHCDDEGFVTQEFIDYWEARAKGGYAYCVTEYTLVSPEGQPNKDQLAIWDDKYIPGLTKLAEAVHKHNSLIAVELHHAGRGANMNITKLQAVGPSPIPDPTIGDVPEEMTREQIYDLIEKFGDGAVRAKKAGIDAVELHGGHGYLICQFFSPFSNKRTDEFGGDIEGRCRFATLILENIKKKCGSDYTVGIRISSHEHMDGALTVQESKAIAMVLEDAGFDYINVSNGNYVQHNYSHSVGSVPPGYNVMAAAEIKKVVKKIPIFAVGRLSDPYLGEAMLRSGDVDVIPLGRGSIADPEYPNKVIEGRIDEISPCILCMQRCQGQAYDMNDSGISCMINPFTGKEGKWKVEPTTAPKKIVVVGGGPGGMQFAWLAAKRGHKVVLFEAQDQPGGQFRAAAVPPAKQSYTKAIKYQLTMCRKFGVDVRFNTEATVELIEAEKPDHVILATGARPSAPPIPGLDKVKWVHAIDVLMGRAKYGDNCLVIGGGLVGCETADFLLEQTKSVTIMEMDDEIALEEHAAPKYFQFKRFEQGGVKVITEAKVTEFIKRGVIYENADDELVTLKGYDTVVMAIGSKPYNPLEDELKAKGMTVNVIGDAVKVRKALHAIYEATELAITI